MPAGRVDLVDALAFPLPFSVIAEMLGTPPADHERIRQLTGTVVRSLEPVADPELAAAILAADDELIQIAVEMIAWKRANPADDLPLPGRRVRAPTRSARSGAGHRLSREFGRAYVRSPANAAIVKARPGAGARARKAEL